VPVREMVDPGCSADSAQKKHPPSSAPYVETPGGYFIYVSSLFLLEYAVAVSVKIAKMTEMNNRRRTWWPVEYIIYLQPVFNHFSI